MRVKELLWCLYISFSVPNDYAYSWEDTVAQDPHLPCVVFAFFPLLGFLFHFVQSVLGELRSKMPMCTNACERSRQYLIVNIMRIHHSYCQSTLSLSLESTQLINSLLHERVEAGNKAKSNPEETMHNFISIYHAITLPLASHRGWCVYHTQGVVGRSHIGQACWSQDWSAHQQHRQRGGRSEDYSLPSV